VPVCPFAGLPVEPVEPVGPLSPACPATGGSEPVRRYVDLHQYPMKDFFIPDAKPCSAQLSPLVIINLQHLMPSGS
jgi:hypothetical protein